MGRVIRLRVIRARHGFDQLDERLENSSVGYLRKGCAIVLINESILLVEAGRCSSDP